MRAAADCNNIKACFPVAVIYSVVDGTTSRGFSDNFWIQSCVRELAGCKSILSLPWDLSPHLGPPQTYSLSFSSQSLVHFRAVSGRS